MGGALLFLLPATAQTSNAAGAQVIEVKVKLLDSVGLVAYCGDIVYSANFRFELTGSNGLLMKGRRISFQCPRERFGECYFRQGSEYVFRVRRLTGEFIPAGASWFECVM